MSRCAALDPPDLDLLGVASEACEVLLDLWFWKPVRSLATIVVSDGVAVGVAADALANFLAASPTVNGGVAIIMGSEARLGV